MKQIIPHLLWLGHLGEAAHARPLFDAGIRAVVELAAEEPPSRPPRELVYCRFPLVDGPGNDADLLSLAVAAVAALLRWRVPTLVCCGSGLSRSPAVAAAALAQAQGEKPEDCLARLAEQHPCDVSPGLWNELRKVAVPA